MSPAKLAFVSIIEGCCAKDVKQNMIKQTENTLCIAINTKKHKYNCEYGTGS